MKSKIQLTLLILPLLLFVQFASAQVGFGPRAGINLVSAAGKNSSAMFRFGLHLGAYAKIPVAENLVFQPELLYSIRGYGYYTGYGYNSTQRLYYLDVPLLLNYGTSEGVHFIGGLQPSVLLGAKYIDNGNTTSKGKNKDDYRTMDVAAVVGVGYQAEEGFNADLRFGYGLFPLLSDDSPNRIHSFCFQLTAGYTFGGK